MNSSRLSLLRLCNELGEPGRDLVLSAEGNVSSRLDDPADGSRRMIIKASGCSLATMTDDDLLLVDRRLISPLLDQPDGTDDITAAAYRSSVIDAGARPRMPSVEAILHAVIYDETGVQVIAQPPGKKNSSIHLQITSMVVKVARIISGSLAAGGPRFLDAANVDRIENRPDEQYRRALLTGQAANPTTTIKEA